MVKEEAIRLARSYFLTEDNVYGCTETTFIVLQSAYGFANATDSSPAMALNGGVAWSGGTCGAITGAALAVGRLAADRITDHKAAKSIARAIIMRLIDDFRAAFSCLECRCLIGLDISTEEGHAAFINGKLWHTVCMGQIEFVLNKLVVLQDEDVWRDTIRQIQS